MSRLHPSFKRREASQIVLGGLILAIILNLYLLPLILVKGDGQTIIEKPLDPVYINSKKTTPGIPNIDIEIGEAWEIIYTLEAGKRYHIFLVGRFVNFSKPLTDYDIFTYAPDGDETWHTESAGFPEHVANDNPHRLFKTRRSGQYRFQIVNDKRDSNGTDPAVFMLIEHIETDKWYTRDFKGRENDKPVYNTTWSYEFTTDAEHIRVVVNVSDGLDMYEARLYPMANMKAKIGYDLWGIPVPFGSLLKGETEYDNVTETKYGGYNTTIEGWRNSKLTSSCEYKGDDMEIWFELAEPINYTYPTNVTSNISYYLCLIAERGEGEANFYIQTDFTPPILSLVDPPEQGYAGEETEIKTAIKSVSPIKRAWVEYTEDEGKTWDKRDLRPGEDLFACDLPPFSPGGYVNYTVYAKDDLGSIGNITAGFQVKNRVELYCEVDKTEITMDQKVEVIGAVTPKREPLMLEFTKKEQEETVKVIPDDTGMFKYQFTPKSRGDWKLQATYNGSELDYPSSSDVITLSVVSVPTSIDCSISSNEVKRKEPLTVTGTVSPPAQGLTVEVTFASPSSFQTEIIVTDASGGFSYSLYPSELGEWNVIAQLKDESLRYVPSQSGLMEFAVVPLTIIDKVVKTLTRMITPPLLYMTIGGSGVCATIALFRFRDRLPKSITSKFPSLFGKGNNRSKKGRGKYSRRRR